MQQHSDNLSSKIRRLYNLCTELEVDFGYALYKQLYDRNNEQAVGYSKFKILIKTI